MEAAKAGQEQHADAHGVSAHADGRKKAADSLAAAMDAVPTSARSVDYERGLRATRRDRFYRPGFMRGHEACAGKYEEAAEIYGGHGGDQTEFHERALLFQHKHEADGTLKQDEEEYQPDTGRPRHAHRRGGRWVVGGYNGAAHPAAMQTGWTPPPVNRGEQSVDASAVEERKLKPLPKAWRTVDLSDIADETAKLRDAVLGVLRGGMNPDRQLGRSRSARISIAKHGESGHVHDEGECDGELEPAPLARTAHAAEGAPGRQGSMLGQTDDVTLITNMMRRAGKTAAEVADVWEALEDGHLDHEVGEKGVRRVI